MVAPRWTEKLFKPSGGQDHLGLGSVSSDRILPQLAPGVNVIPIHPRYWSLYTFLLHEFWQRDLPRTRAAWVQFYRPRECIFAIGAHLCDRREHGRAKSMAGIVGARRISAYVRARDSFDPQFNYIDSELGGYGLYYSTVMAAMGLIVLAVPEVGVPCDAPTPEGRIVAEGFGQAIAGTTYYREYFDDDRADIPASVALEYARAACLCQLQTRRAPDRTLLRDTFLHGGPPEDAAARRTSLRMVLDIAHQTDGHGLDEDTFRQLIYFRRDVYGAKYDPIGDLGATARRWRLYQAREYYAYALMRIWRSVCLWGMDATNGGAKSVPAEDLLEFVERSLDVRRLGKYLAVSTPKLDRRTSFSTFNEWVSGASSLRAELDKPWRINTPLNEHTLYDACRQDDDPAAVVAAVAMLSLLAQRFWSPATAVQYADDWELVREGDAERLGLDRFLRHVRKRTMAGDSLGEIARWLTLEYVVRQHERIATAKLPSTGDTYRFRFEGSRLRFFPQEAPAGMNAARFDALSTIVYELGLVGPLTTDRHPLSADGKSFLKIGDLPDRGVTGGRTETE